MVLLWIRGNLSLRWWLQCCELRRLAWHSIGRGSLLCIHWTLGSRALSHWCVHRLELWGLMMLLELMLLLS